MYIDISIQLSPPLDKQVEHVACLFAGAIGYLDKNRACMYTETKKLSQSISRKRYYFC